MIEQIAVGGFDNNFSYVVHDGSSAAIADPSGDIEKVFTIIQTKGLVPVAVLITHSHFDHVDKLSVFLDRYPVPVYLHELAHEYVDIKTQPSFVADGDKVVIGGLTISVLHTPGHIDDALCFYLDADQTKDGVPQLICGDTLFVCGCGRVASEHDAEKLYESLQRIKALPDETRVFPGHDYDPKPVSTVQWEKENNRFMFAQTVEDFKEERL